MDDGNQMMAAILAAPDDDAPRRVYADWLRACGDPRGEFITLQLDNRGWNPAADALRRQHEATWLPPIEGLHVSAWRRGFPECVFMDAKDFLFGADELFAKLPVREVSLRHCGGWLAVIAGMPHLAKLRSLDLGDEADLAGLEELAASPWLSGVATLGMAGSPIGDAGAAILAGASGLSGLSSLSLIGCGIGPDGARRLAGSTILGRLTDLMLGRNPLGGGIAALAASPHLGPLERLYLHDCKLRDADAAALAASPRLGRLMTLTLEDNAIGDAGAAALAASQGFASLVYLKLSQNVVGDAGAAAFGASTSLAALTELDLSENRIHEAGAEALAAGKGLPALKTLVLSFNSIYVPGATENWEDQGMIVGSGPVRMDSHKLNALYGGRFRVT